MVNIELFLNIIPAIGVIIALVYYSMTLRYTTKARQRELIFLRAQSYSLEYADAYADVTKMDDWDTVLEFHNKYGVERNPRAFAKWLYIRNVFNTAGLLLMEKEADPNLIFSLYAPNAIIRLWDRHEPLIREARKRFKYPDYYKPFEYLYNEAKKRYPDIPTQRELGFIIDLQEESTE